MSYIHKFEVKQGTGMPDVLEIVSAMPIYECQPDFNADRLPLLVKEIESLLKGHGITEAIVFPMAS
jgi:hypothetical protein